jgi:hypothetical protein
MNGLQFISALRNISLKLKNSDLSSFRLTQHTFSTFSHLGNLQPASYRSGLSFAPLMSGNSFISCENPPAFPAIMTRASLLPIPGWPAQDFRRSNSSTSHLP